MSRVLIVKNLDDLDIVLRVVRDECERKGNLRVTIEEHDESSEKRRTIQNNLAFHWYKHIAFALEDGTPEEKRAYCKLHFGVPIRREDEKFREVYDRVIRPLQYHQKIELMGSPIDFPVTRDMTIKEMARYLNCVDQHFAEIGVVLPRKDDLYYAAMGLKRKP